MKTELKEILNKEYSESKLTDFSIKTQKIYEFFGYKFNLHPKDFNNKKIENCITWLNDDYKDSVISNLTKITFKFVYPKLIAKIISTNLDCFNEVYSKLIELYENEKNIEDRVLLKKYLCITYGCLINKESIIYSNNIHLVSIIVRKLMLNILNEFKSHIIHIDCDQIFFRNFNEIEDRFEKNFSKINKFDLAYMSEKSSFGYFSTKKGYLTEESGYIKVYGLKHFNIDGVSKGGYIKMLNN